MEQISAKNFEQVLNSTVRMIRSSWNVSVCLFIQMDDHGLLRIRASDGLRNLPRSFGFKPAQGAVAQCLNTDKVLGSGDVPWDEGMKDLLKPVETASAHNF